MARFAREQSFDDPTEAVTPRALDLGPVNVPDAPEVLASILRKKILSGELAEGASLPAERGLVEQTRLSRATVRDALRILQVQGLIVRRPGRGGGAVVTRPGADDVVVWLDLALQGRRLDKSVLLEAREIIEPWCAALAAERRTDEDLRALEARHARMQRVVNELPAYLEANVEWHMAVADASHNELLAALMHALSKAVLRETGGEQFNTAETRRSALQAHELVMQAIQSGDAAAARRRMARHVHAFATALLLGSDDVEAPASTPTS